MPTLPAPAPVPNIRDMPDLFAALAHEDANPANWQGTDPALWNGVADTSEEGGLK